MKRMTDEELVSAYFQAASITSSQVKGLIGVADAQLQADKQAVEECREKIVEWLLDDQESGLHLGIGHAELIADQIISLLGEE